MGEPVDVDVGMCHQQINTEGGSGRAEQGGHARSWCAGVQRHHLPEHADELGGHLLGAAEPRTRIGIDGAAQKPVVGVVLGQHGILAGQPVLVAALAGGHAQGQHRQGPPHRVDVRGDGGAGLGDLGRLVAGCAVQVAVGVDRGHRAQVDELELLLGDHDVLGLEVVVGETHRM
ncbi:Uncharacterised protein [Mycobacteroides abscessus]|nr:Uncharacterised protein [Mycobacteroides abscessus]